MKKTILFAAITTLIATQPLWALEDTHSSGKNLGNVVGGDFKKAHEIIQKRCTNCHSTKVIEAALAANKDMMGIQKAMEKKGAGLSAKEREVLGIYWKQNPLKKK